MRRYETIVIVDPDLSEPDRNQRFDKIIDLINQMKGVLIEKDDWGSKRLAYEIKKKTRGYYMRFDFCGTGDLVAELERTCRIDDKFLKYMTIILQDKADPEAIKKELAESKAKKEEEEASRAQLAAEENKTDDSSDDDSEKDDSKKDDSEKDEPKKDEPENDDSEKDDADDSKEEDE